MKLMKVHDTYTLQNLRNHLQQVATFSLQLTILKSGEKNIFEGEWWAATRHH